MNRLKTFTLALLLSTAAFPLSAQVTGTNEASGTDEAAETYIFRFVADKDMFYSPWNGNENQLELLYKAIDENREAIESGNMYIYVTSHCVVSRPGEPNAEIAKIRRNRVKSELILRCKVKEANFVTDKGSTTPYETADRRFRYVVLVTLPASAGQVARISGEAAAERVREYERKLAEAEKAEAERIAAEKAEAERIAAEKERLTAEKAEAERIAAEKAEAERLAAENAAAGTTDADNAAQAKADAERAAEEQTSGSRTGIKSGLSLRTNLLRWATLTPDLGIEWRPGGGSWGLLVNGSYTSYTWNGKDRRYALWEVAPEVRCYLGEQKRGYVGAMFKAGQFNVKFSETGKQGRIIGGGLTGGYLLPLNRSLALDFSLGLGYIRADYDKYTVINDVRVRRGNETRNWWGPTSAGVTLVWTIF